MVRIASLLFVPLALLGAPQVLAQQAEKPQIKVGQVSVFVQRVDNAEREDTQTVVSVEGDVVRVRTADDKEGLFTGEWNTVLSSLSGNRFEPHVAVLRFPITVGKTWPAAYQTLTASGMKISSDLTATVTGFEKARLPAGEFDVFKVQLKGWANGGFGSRRVEQQVWYAPALQRVVRVEYKDWQGSGAFPRAHTVTELKAFSDPK